MSNNLFDSLEFCEDIIEEDDINKDTTMSWKKVFFFLKAILWVGISYIILLSCLEANNKNLFFNNELIISDMQQSAIISELELELGISIPKEDVENYLILNAIRTNDKLTKEEKEIFYDFIQIIKDNPYINKEDIYKSFSDVYISYMKKPDDIEENVLADYTASLDLIRVFTENPEETKKTPPEPEVEHEGIHAMFNKKLPKWFKEGATQLYRNEYYSDNPYVEYITYPIEVSAVKLLCEVTNEDIVLEAYTIGDFSLIEKYIANLLNDKALANQSLELLGKSIENKDNKRDKRFIEQNSRCLEIFDLCIQKKYEQDPDYQAIPYFYNKLLVSSVFSDIYYDAYCNVIDTLGVLEKGYFSKELQEKEVKLVKTLK